MGKVLTSFTRLLLPAVAVAAVAVTACTDDGCSENTSSVPQAGFYVSGERNRPATITKLTVRGIGAPGDSAIIDTQTVSTVYLPLRLKTGKSQFVFDYYGDSLVNDTLTLDYTPVPYFVSKECGAMYNFEVKGVECTSHEIDSVVMPHSMLTNADGVKIRIYVKQ